MARDSMHLEPCCPRVKGVVVVIEVGVDMLRMVVVAVVVMQHSVGLCW